LKNRLVKNALESSGGLLFGYEDQRLLLWGSKMPVLYAVAAWSLRAVPRFGTLPLPAPEIL
jgi:hypothetical protein